MYRNVTIGNTTFTTNGTYVLNSIDIGSPEVDITSVPMNVGDFVIGNRMGGRDITLTGYVCTRESQNSSTSSIVYLKQQLQKLLLPLKEVTLKVDGCSIECYPKSSIEWSVPFKENNKELCKFSIDLFAPNPFFQAPLKRVFAEDTFTFIDSGTNSGRTYVIYDASNKKKADFKGTFEASSPVTTNYITVNVNGTLYKKFSVNKAGRVFEINSYTGFATLDGSPLTVSQSGTLKLMQGENRVEVVADQSGFVDCTSMVYSGAVPLERTDWYCEGKYLGIEKDSLIVTQNMVSEKEMDIIVYNRGHNTRDYLTFSFTTSPANPSRPPFVLNLKLNGNPWITVNRESLEAPWGEVSINMYTGSLTTQYNDSPNIKEWNSEFLRPDRNVIKISIDEGTVYSLMNKLKYGVSLLEV